MDIEQIYHVKEGYFSQKPLLNMMRGIFGKYPSRTCYICLITSNVNVQKCIDDRDVISVQLDIVFLEKYHGRVRKKGISFLHIPRRC